MSKLLNKSWSSSGLAAPELASSGFGSFNSSDIKIPREKAIRTPLNGKDI
jgi:hypothetical protein